MVPGAVPPGTVFSRSPWICASPPVGLFVEHFFNLADFLLNLAGEFFVLPFGH
jgi:hypothetical protein